MAEPKSKKSAGPQIDPFKAYFPIGEAVALLLHPLAEVVVHDLRTGRIIRIWNSFTDRQAGDLSTLAGAEDTFPTDRMILGPYDKALASQGRTKSITSGINDADNNLIGFLCINLNVTMLDAATSFLSTFASSEMHRPEPFYRNDLQQHINYLVRDYSLKINKPIEHISRSERSDLVAEVNAAGLFQARNAVALLAKAMHISRASVYNILAEIKSADGGADSGEAKAVANGRGKAATRPSRKSATGVHREIPALG